MAIHSLHFFGFTRNLLRKHVSITTRPWNCKTVEGIDLTQIYLTGSKSETSMAPTPRNSESTTTTTTTTTCTATNATSNITEDAFYDSVAPSLDQMNPQEFIARIREQGICNFPKPTDNIGADVDLDHLVRTTRAILAMNNEIWMRCKQARQTDKSSTLSSTEGAIFERIAFQTISSKNSQPGTLGFMTTPELKHKDFGLPPPIPQELTDIIALKTKGPQSVFPDYALFFERSLLLHEDVLMPFLFKLKDHLEWIQVFLGQIDAWLMEPVSYVEFIKEVFDKELIIPTKKEGTTTCTKDCTVKHPAPSCCLVCGQPFSSHRQYSQDGFNSRNGFRSSFHKQVYQNDGGHLCFDVNSRSEQPVGWGSFMFFSPDPQLLKTCEASGEHTETFDIGMEIDRKRLKMFLEFVSCK
jgi:hypothetical protein